MKQKIIIIGCARSGLAGAKLAKSQGHEVTLYDKKAKQDFSLAIQNEMEQLRKEGIHLLLGCDVALEAYDLSIVSPGVPLDLPFIARAMQQGKKIIGEFEYASTYCHAPMIAITGTNGKTTTTTLVGEIMSSAYEETFVVGNIGTAFSEKVLEMTKEAVVVAEVSSFQLETTTTFHPHVAALLNITPDHLNRHKTMENYIQAKCEVTRNQNENDFLILNKKDQYFDKAKLQTKAKVIPFYGEGVLDYGVYQKEGKLYENIFGKENFVCDISELKIVGKHNVENVLAAIAVCRVYGLECEVIRQGLLNFKGVEHRVEYVLTKNNIDYYNDSKATNTDAAITGILSMSKPIRLIAGGMDKKVSFDEWVDHFEGRVEKVYVIGECQTQIIDACSRKNYHQIEAFQSFEEAIDKAVAEAEQGECVLLSPACASWDMFESYEQRGELFKERIKKMEG